MREVPMTKRIYSFFLAAFFVISSTPVFADVGTTSSLRGVVNIAGATVTAEHTPTGATKSKSASVDGAFYLSNLPIGGPYQITVSASGYQTETLGGVYLQLNKTTEVTVSLASSDVEEITVTGTVPEGSIRMGSGTFLDREADRKSVV